MEHGGEQVVLRTAVFKGMMPGGAFVYACDGDYFDTKWKSKESFEYDLIPAPYPDYLRTFKVKLAHDPKVLDNIKPEALEAIARAKRRQLADGWVLCWGS